MDITHCFKDNGSFSFDPWNTAPDDARFQAIFDEHGNLHDGMDGKIRKMVKNNSWSPWCEAVAIVHAQRMVMTTKGGLNAIHYFR